MMINRRLPVLVANFNRIALCVVVVVVIVSCESSAQILGKVDLKNGESAKFAFCIPARSQSQVGWSLRFRMLPWTQFDSLKASDSITVYLGNDNNSSIGFLKQIDDSKIIIQPGKKAEIFRGKLSEFILVGRGEKEAMAFDPATTNLNFTLHFAPQLESATSCTIQVSIGHYPDHIL